MGQKTRRERRVVIERALRDLHHGGLELRRLKNFGEKHVLRILSDWRARALEPSTLSTYISHLRTFCSWLDKPQFIQLLDEAVAAEPELVRRRTVTDVDKSEKAIDLNVPELLDRAKALDERFAAQLGLIVAFGLRSREAWLCRPHLVLERARKEGVVRVEWGTKGGRSRVLQVAVTAEHLAVLEWACTFAKARSESMILPHWTVQRWRRYYYGCCEKLGLTRRTLGVTPHAFRHGVLLDLYEWLTGHPAPARGGTLAQTDPSADRAARELVSAHAGHAEIHITSAYLGGLRPRRQTTAPDGETASSPSDPAEVPRSETVAGSSSVEP